MNTLHMSALILCVNTASFAPGCALFSKGDQGAARYFSLEQATGRSGVDPLKPSLERVDPAQLRLDRVTGAPHLEERLVYRSTSNEIGYYRELRWAEPPELCLKQLLTRVLFEERGLRQVVGGAAPTLEVQLTALDEIRLPKHLARVQVIAKLHDEHLVLWEETLTVDRPIAGSKDGDVALATVTALSDAMRAAVDQIADRVVQRLEQEREHKTKSKVEERR